MDDTDQGIGIGTTIGHRTAREGGTGPGTPHERGLEARPILGRSRRAWSQPSAYLDRKIDELSDRGVPALHVADLAGIGGADLESLLCYGAKEAARLHHQQALSS